MNTLPIMSAVSILRIDDWNSRRINEIMKCCSTVRHPINSRKWYGNQSQRWELSPNCNCGSRFNASSHGDVHEGNESRSKLRGTSSCRRSSLSAAYAVTDTDSWCSPSRSIRARRRLSKGLRDVFGLVAQAKVMPSRLSSRYKTVLETLRALLLSHYGDLVIW